MFSTTNLFQTSNIKFKISFQSNACNFIIFSCSGFDSGMVSDVATYIDSMTDNFAS